MTLSSFIAPYLTLWHLQMLVVYILANCALPWYVIWYNQRLKPVEGREAEKFQPFVRIDIHQWSYLRCIFTHFFLLPRLLGVLSFFAIVLGGVLILSIGAKLDENMSDTRRWLISEYVALCMRLFSPIWGVVYYRNRRPKVDYSKWLGPNWEPTYDGATMLVCNHQSWYDIVMTFLFVRPMPGFIAKTSIKRIPAVGAAATAIGSIFFDRRDRTRRNEVFELIKEKQDLAEKKLAGPLLLYPEGCSTNGESLAKFKKGAFANLKPVKPLVIRCDALIGCASRGCLMGIFHWFILIPCMNVFVWPELLEMPIFAPNAYFWSKYWDGKNEEDKWKVFAEAVREAMAECGGLKLSDSS